MPAMESYVALNSYTLLDLNRAAISSKYNRSLSTKFIENIDPDGVHIITFTFIHNDDHVRAMLMIKVKGRIEPVHATLDMSIKNYMSLPRFAYNDAGEIYNVKTNEVLSFDEVEAQGKDGTLRT
jgi:hypothetical protein